MPPEPVLVLHGGSGRRPAAARLRRIRKRLRAIGHAGAAHLRRHSALETVAWVVARLEDDPLFNAGTGSYLQHDGRARMSASIMDGASRRFAAVLNVEHVRHPVLVARALLAQEDRVLAGSGALRFARVQGFGPWNPVTRERLRQWQHLAFDPSTQGTVGAVALDAAGHLAAATSTGGKGHDPIGRVSDSGMPVGNYADELVAISCTGCGEDIMDEGLAVRIAQQVADGAPLPRAFAAMFRRLRADARRSGAIGLDRRGRMVWATTLPILLAVGGSRRLATSF